MGDAWVGCELGDWGASVGIRPLPGRRGAGACTERGARGLQGAVLVGGKAGPQHRAPPVPCGCRGLVPGWFGSRQLQGRAGPQGVTLTAPSSGTPPAKPLPQPTGGGGSGPRCCCHTGRLEARLGKTAAERRWRARQKIHRGRESPGRIRPPDK